MEHGDGAAESADASELDRIQKECASMVNTLKSLHEEERQLRESNHVLAQKAAIMGCTAGLDGGTRRGARRKADAIKKAAAAKKVSATQKPSSEPSVEKS